jgi:hypothetical protein
MATNVRKLKTEEFPVQEETISLADCEASEEDACLPDRDARIAELAYYKAESRGFEPGYEMEDWLDAERELTL